MESEKDIAPLFSHDEIRSQTHSRCETQGYCDCDNAMIRGGVPPCYLPPLRRPYGYSSSEQTQTHLEAGPSTTCTIDPVDDEGSQETELTVEGAPSTQYQLQLRRLKGAHSPKCRNPNPRHQQTDSPTMQQFNDLTGVVNNLIATVQQLSKQVDTIQTWVLELKQIMPKVNTQPAPSPFGTYYKYGVKDEV